MINVDKPVKVLNQQQYVFEIKLHNDSGELLCNPATILHMMIEDDLHFWPVKGFVVIENAYEIIERKLSNSSSGNSSNKPPFTFKNDGTDYIDITIYPLNGDQPDQFKYPDKIWKIMYKCVIYDKEDYLVPNSSVKMKKFYFWDVDYQKMLADSIQWSTATSMGNKAVQAGYDPAQGRDDERKMKTGEAIKYYLQESKLDFQINEDIFDLGSNKIFYTTFQNLNIWQNVEYMLNEHLSKKEDDKTDICVFNKDRFTGKFELEPYHKVFKKAGNKPEDPKEYQIEHLFFEDVGSVEKVPIYKAPINREVTTDIDIKLGRIKKYQYIDTSSVDNTELFNTRPIYTYDFKNKTFSINMKDSNVNILKNKISEYRITERLLGAPEPILPLTDNQKTNKKILPTYSIRSTKGSVLKKGLGSLLYTEMFLNLGIYIELEGASFRRSGRFVGIDRQTFSDCNFDYKLCGQWFITKVKHIFCGEIYTNEIVAVKLNSFKAIT